MLCESIQIPNAHKIQLYWNVLKARLNKEEYRLPGLYSQPSKVQIPHLTIVYNLAQSKVIIVYCFIKIL